MMLMKEGSDGDNDPELVRDFIDTTNTIGFGDPEGGTGYGGFEATKKGDVVIVRAGGKKFVMVQIDDDSVQKYVENPNFPKFDWLCSTKKVKVLSWYDTDEEKLSLPQFDWRGYQQTFCTFSGKNLEIAHQWYSLITQNKEIKIGALCSCDNLQKWTGKQLSPMLLPSSYIRKMPTSSRSLPSKKFSAD